MARYELRNVGAFDKEAGVEILPCTPEWTDYCRWLVAGGMPDPMPPVPVDLERVRADLTGQVNAVRDRQLAAGITFNGHRYDSDPASRANLVGVVASISAGIPLPDGFVWRDADNNEVPMDGPGLTELGAALLAHTYACHVYSWELKAQLLAAEDPRPIDIREGWPE